MPKKKKLSIPFYFPRMALNKLSIKIFNGLYYFLNRRKPRESLVDLDSFFYPLDNIGDWNRIYGKKGFIQYQCVIPIQDSGTGITKILEAISEAGLGSFLAVLKLFGPSGSGLCSFPCEGLTLALDFKYSPQTLKLCDRLDELVKSYGGHLYITKDSRQSAKMFNDTHPGVKALKKFRKTSNADAVFSSAQSQRLKL